MNIQPSSGWNPSFIERNLTGKRETIDSAKFDQTNLDEMIYLLNNTEKTKHLSGRLSQLLQAFNTATLDTTTKLKIKVGDNNESELDLKSIHETITPLVEKVLKIAKTQQKDTWTNYLNISHTLSAIKNYLLGRGGFVSSSYQFLQSTPISMLENLEQELKEKRAAIPSHMQSSSNRDLQEINQRLEVIQSTLKEQIKTFKKTEQRFNELSEQLTEAKAKVGQAKTAQEKAETALGAFCTRNLEIINEAIDAFNTGLDPDPSSLLTKLNKETPIETICHYSTTLFQFARDRNILDNDPYKDLKPLVESFLKATETRNQADNNVASLQTELNKLQDSAEHKKSKEINALTANIETAIGEIKALPAFDIKQCKDAKTLKDLFIADILVQIGNFREHCYTEVRTGEALGESFSEISLKDRYDALIRRIDDVENFGLQIKEFEKSTGKQECLKTLCRELRDLLKSLYNAENSEALDKINPSDLTNTAIEKYANTFATAAKDDTTG